MPTPAKAKAPKKSQSTKEQLLLKEMEKLKKTFSSAATELSLQMQSLLLS